MYWRRDSTLTLSEATQMASTGGSGVGGGIALSPDLVRSLTVGKVFKQQNGAISSLDFDDAGA